MIEVKLAHSEGHSDFTFSSDGRYQYYHKYFIAQNRNYLQTNSQIITCGREGDIKIWNANEDKDPKTISVGECVTAIDFAV